MVDINRIKAVADKGKERIEKTKSLAPIYGERVRPSLFGGERRTPYVTTGPVGKDSAGYSLARAAAYAARLIGPEDCKEELNISEKLKSFYGYQLGDHGTSKSISILGSANPMYHPVQLRDDSNGKTLLQEWKQKLFAGVQNYDPDEIKWTEKTLGTYPSTAGGTFIPPPTLLADYIDLQRNMAVFPKAGATEITFGPNGAVTIPRLTGASTGYWVGEGATITESTATTGDLQLRAKKLGTRTRLTLEGQNFSNPSLEAMARRDMALQSAITADLAMLEGTGGVKPKGLITYTGDSNSYLNIQTVVATTTGANGNTIQPEDVRRMVSYLPDAIAMENVKWVMNPFMFAPILNRRADAVSASDGKGPFVFNIVRRTDEKMAPVLDGSEVIVSRNVSQNRTKGSGTDLNYILLGYWPEWVIARYGAFDVMMNPYGDTDFANGTVSLRSIQYIDGGPRTPNSFIFMDTLLAS